MEKEYEDLYPFLFHLPKDKRFIVNSEFFSCFWILELVLCMKLCYFFGWIESSTLRSSEGCSIQIHFDFVMNSLDRFFQFIINWLRFLFKKLINFEMYDFKNLTAFQSNLNYFNDVSKIFGQYILMQKYIWNSKVLQKNYILYCISILKSDHQ